MKKCLLFISGMLLLLTVSLTSCSKKVGCYYTEFYEVKASHPSFAKTNGQFSKLTYSNDEVCIDYIASATKTLD